MMIAPCSNGLLHHHVQLGTYNAPKLIEFLDKLNIIVDETPHTIIVDNVRFHKTTDAELWFDRSPHTVRYLPPYSPFFNPVEEVVSKMKHHVKQRHSVNRTHLLHSMDTNRYTIRLSWLC